MSDYPVAKSDVVDNTTDAMAKYINNIEDFIGLRDDTDTSTLDYLSKAVPRGFLINGKIVPSVANNDLTVALKGMDGNDPSATNPVYCKIGNTVRKITAALSVTRADGTNWFDCGSVEHGTYEHDYFVYLGYNATDGVTIGFSRIPLATVYSMFATTTPAERYGAISTITNAAAGDAYENIGRFAATLSLVGTGYLWTVPTFTDENLIQRPMFETRILTYLPTITFAGTPPSSPDANYTAAQYKLSREMVWLHLYRLYGSAGTSVTQINATLPFKYYGLTDTGLTMVGLGFGITLPVTTTKNVLISNTATMMDIASIALTQFGMSFNYPLNY